MSRDIYLSDVRYVAALNRIQGQIKEGLPLIVEDSDVSGNKFCYVTWGLCSDDPKQWPDGEDRLNTINSYRETADGKFEPRKIVHVKYLKGKQSCPFDTGPDDHGLSGCFYRCRFFQADKDNPQPTQEEAVKLYQIALNKRGPKCLPSSVTLGKSVKS